MAKFPEGQLVIVVDGIVVGSALSLLVTEDFAFKTRSYSYHRKFHVLNSQSWWRVLYGIDVLLILNIEAWDWVAVYMTYEKIVRAIESEIYHFAGRIPNYGKFKDEITLKFT
jgi:hypothetical protein